MTLRLGLPSKGRLMERTLEWFAARGVAIAKAGSDRGYAALADMPGLDVALMSAGDIARDLGSGRLHLGVTGDDLVQEKIAGWDRRLRRLAPLGFGEADLVVAVPAFWADVTHLDDLDAVAGEFRRQHGFRLRIATKYHRLVREFLAAKGVADYQLIDSQGATEGTVAAETAEAVADITSTGETLAANGLRALSDGLILSSQAALWRSGAARWDADALAGMAALSARLGLAEP